MKNFKSVLRNGYITEEELMYISKENKDYIEKNWDYITNIHTGKGYYIINNRNLTTCDYNQTKIYCQFNNKII